MRSCSMFPKVDAYNQFIIHRSQIAETPIDIEGKTLIVAFNEPKFRATKKEQIDAKLNARFITYFLPAVQIAKKQEQRPRLYISSAINMGLMWNAQDGEEQKIMMANNNIKVDFLQHFFDTFFPDTFSLIEYIFPQDVLKVPESKFISLWNTIERKYVHELADVKFQLTKFLYPKTFNVKSIDDLSAEQIKLLHEIDASVAFKYAISHLFALGDVNFTGNYIHNPNGYVSIGGEQEEVFNKVRHLAFSLIEDCGELLFKKEMVLFDNYRIIVKDDFLAPVPYNGMYGQNELLEVTYENGRTLSYYDEQEKVTEQMQHMYKQIVSQEQYQHFWNQYRKRYFDLKERYREAYNITSNW